MAHRTIKMTYIPAQFRVRVEFTKADCLAMSEPPKDVLDRAKARLRREQKKGNVAFYRIFKTRLFVMWEALRVNDEPPDTRVAVTFVTGAPPMPGVHLALCPNGDCLARVTITASAGQIAQWPFKLFKLTVGKYLRDRGVPDVADAGHLHGLWIRAGRGETITHFPIHAAPIKVDLAKVESGYSILTRASDGEIHLVIYRLRTLIEAHKLDEIVQMIRARAEVLQKQTGKTYRILGSYLTRELASAYRGPERFGLDLPFVCLAAIEESQAQAAQRLGRKLAMPKYYEPRPEATTKVLTGDSKNAEGVLSDVALGAPPHPFDRYMTVTVSADKLSACIDEFHQGFFQTQWTNAEELWRSFLASKRIVSAIDQVPNLLQMMERRVPLERALVAKGLVPLVGTDPYMLKVDAQKEAGELAQNAEDLRERQQRTFVQKGQPVARMAFRKPSVPGVDVFGMEIPAPTPSTSGITLGEGLEVAGEFFVATFDGIPTLNTSSITLARALVIKNGVNLATGNVRFEGHVEIKGSVEEGATVNVIGDILITGLILGGVVRATGTITVLGGITSHHSGYVHAGANIHANFVAQANIECGGDLIVEKNILNSQLFVRGSITVTQPDGVVSGGEVFAEKGLMCGHLGRTTGPATIIRIGCDAKQGRRVAMLKARQAKFQATMRAIQNNQNYRDKDLAIMSARQIKEKEKIASQAERGQRILARLAVLLMEAESKVVYNSKGRVMVQQVLSRNCQLMIGGKPIPIKSDVAGVQVTADKVRGEYIVAMAAAPEKAS